MDLFNNKKLKEREEEIQRLEKAVRELKQELKDQKSQNEKLKAEKDKEAELHQKVVDKMLGEIQELIVDNNHKDLSFRTLDTLFPLIKDLIDTQKFVVRLGIRLPHLFDHVGKKRRQELLLAYSKNITNKWESLGLVEESVIDEVFTASEEVPIQGCSVKVFSKFTPEDLIFRMKGIVATEYNLSTEDFFINVKDLQFIYENQNIIIRFSYDFKRKEPLF